MSEMISFPLLACGVPDERRSNEVSGGGRGPGAGDNSTALPIRKPPRKQVSRACEHCRVRRVKCDHGFPCRQCKQKGLKCNSRGKYNDEARTLPQALKEIERLRLKIEELEAELDLFRSSAHSSSRTSNALQTPIQSTPSTQYQQSSNSPSSCEDEKITPAARVQWEGIFAATARSEQTFYHGPSSSCYFVGKMGTFLSHALQESFQDRFMQPRGVNKALNSPTSAGDAETSVNHRVEPSRPSMPRVQEEYFLNLYWESHHLFTPIVREGEFRKLYDELWQGSRTHRKHSALVDIILAISMQYGWAFLLQNTSSTSTQKGQQDDSSIAGRWYYRRCQTLLTTELESPTLKTLQCHLLSVVYLCCASFQNMSHTMLATAVRTAQILGLHLEPSPSMPRCEREHRKRLWWCIYTIEAKTCMKLGRPFSVQKPQISVSLPSDDHEAASFFQSSLGPYDEKVTWLTYSVQTQKFIGLTVDVYNHLYDKCSEVLGRKGGAVAHMNVEGLEECAKYLASQIHPLESWINQVPDGLKLKRRSGGEAFSVDRCPVIFEASAPTWLKRGRICLELIYHTMHINLYRPFITFSSLPNIYTPIADRHAAACADHAIAHIQIMHQVLQETDLMNGWQEYFLWQWNATVTTIGFIMANPIHPTTTNARKAVDMSIEVFEVYGSNFGVAASAAAVTKELIGKADLLSSRLRCGITAAAQSGAPLDELENIAIENIEGLGTMGAEGLTEFMDWTSTVDAFNSFENLFSDANNSMDLWGVGPL